MGPYIGFQPQILQDPHFQRSVHVIFLYVFFCVSVCSFCAQKAGAAVRAPRAGDSR